MSMTRYWMTGCMAVVTMAAQHAQVRAQTEPTHRKHTLSRTSRHSMHTTVGRIEAAAQAFGLSVFAHLEGSNHSAIPHAVTEEILVLGDADGVTPVFQDAWSDTDLGLPLEVRVTEMDDGSSLVTVIDAAFLEDTHVLPSNVVRSVSELPRLIERAIG